MDTNLDHQVREMLEARKGDWALIAEGSNVSYSWLSKFVNGHIPNPGYGTLKGVHQFLTTPQADKQAA